MKKVLLSTILILPFFCIVLFAQSEKGELMPKLITTSATQVPSTEMVIAVKGKYYPQDLVEIVAPQGGVIKYFFKENERVEKKDKLASILSKELLAIQKTTLKYHEEEIENWSKIYPTSDIYTGTSGFILKFEKENLTEVFEGEKIITIAKKNYLAVENTYKMLVKPLKGSKVLLTSKKTGDKIEALVKSFIEKEEGFYKFKLAVVSRDTQLILDDEFIGEILINKKNITSIDKNTVMTRDGKSYVLTLQEIIPITLEGENLKVKGLKGGDNVLLPSSLNPEPKQESELKTTQEGESQGE
jgi:hypothetical protein